MIKEAQVFTTEARISLHKIPASAYFGTDNIIDRGFIIQPRDQVNYFFLKGKLEDLKGKDPSGTDPFTYPERYAALAGLEKINGGTEPGLINKEYKRISLLERNPDPKKTDIYSSIENYRLEHGMIRVFLKTKKLSLKDPETDSDQVTNKANDMEAKRLRGVIEKLEKNIFINERPDIGKKIKQLNIAVEFFSKKAGVVVKLKV